MQRERITSTSEGEQAYHYDAVLQAKGAVMKERPILFSAPMVLAILSGQKTQTRRVMKPQPGNDNRIPFPGKKNLVINVREPELAGLCPHGQPGDRLWVRETCGNVTNKDGGVGEMIYRADVLEGGRSICWTPSIHMPRTASRITLEVTAVRVERLQEMLETDALSEGLTAITKDSGITYKFGIPDRDGLPGIDDYGWPWAEWELSARTAYRKLWDGIYEKSGLGWDVNPWVWVIEFRTLAMVEGKT